MILFTLNHIIGKYYFCLNFAPNTMSLKHHRHFQIPEVAFVEFFFLSISVILPAFEICFRCLLFPHSKKGNQSSLHADRSTWDMLEVTWWFLKKTNSGAALRVGVEGVQGQRSWVLVLTVSTTNSVTSPMLTTQKSIYWWVKELKKSC